MKCGALAAWVGVAGLGLATPSSSREHERFTFQASLDGAAAGSRRVARWAIEATYRAGSDVALRAGAEALNARSPGARFSASAFRIGVEGPLGSDRGRPILGHALWIRAGRGHARTDDSEAEFVGPTTLLVGVRHRGWELAGAEVATPVARARSLSVAVSGSAGGVDWGARLVGEGSRLRPHLVARSRHRLSEEAMLLVGAELFPAGLPLAGHSLDALAGFTLYAPGGALGGARARPRALLGVSLAWSR